jgi:hypothetical protein
MVLKLVFNNQKQQLHPVFSGVSHPMTWEDELPIKKTCKVNSAGFFIQVTFQRTHL